ncbi:MAG: Uma2 family endonuclease [Panacagrimonas sp.]
MQWADVIADPSLQNLMYKIELNKWGKIEMSPATNRHSFFQGRLQRTLIQHFGTGEVFPECSINTTEGVKVADVVWASEAFITRNGLTTPYDEAPEICVEVVSKSNSRAEMGMKVDLYLAAGAIEVWLVFDDGAVEFYRKDGRLETSGFGVRPKLV